MQLSDDITTKLKKYIQDPNVSVLVMGVNSQKIFLVGEVGHVGPIMMTPGMTSLAGYRCRRWAHSVREFEEDLYFAGRGGKATEDSLQL